MASSTATRPKSGGARKSTERRYAKQPATSTSGQRLLKAARARVPAPHYPASEQSVLSAAEQIAADLHAHRAATERQADLDSAVADGSMPSGISAFNLPPAIPFARSYTDPIDLGAYDARFTGMMIIVDRGVPLAVMDAVSEIIQSQDKSPEAGVARALAVREYARLMVVAWNFTRYTPEGKIVPLRQPQDGGLDELPLRDVLNVIVKAAEEALKPNPN